MNRRHFVVLLATTAMSACAGTGGQTPAQIAQTAITDAQLIANALSNVLPNLQGVSPAIASQVTMYAQQAVAAAQSLVATMTQAAAQPIIQQIQTDVTAVAATVQPYLKPGSTAATILSDAQVLMPLLLLAVGLTMQAAAKAGANPDASRARLQALPTRG